MKRLLSMLPAFALSMGCAAAAPEDEDIVSSDESELVTTNSASVWKLTGGVQLNGYALCSPRYSVSNTIYGPNWPYNLYFPHGTIKSPSGARIKVTYTAGTNYYCRFRSARADVAGNQSTLLEVLNIWGGDTSNFWQGNYGRPGKYAGIVSSPFLYTGQKYCPSSCP